EPGTCKDIPLMLATPHVLIEGVAIAAYAIRASHAFIYLRGEVVPVLRRLQQAVAEAYEAGYLGRDVLGSGFDLDLGVHAGAGAGARAAGGGRGGRGRVSGTRRPGQRVRSGPGGARGGRRLHLR